MKNKSFLILLLALFIGGGSVALAQVKGYKALSKTGWNVTASSYNPDSGSGKVEDMIDGDVNTWWHSTYGGGQGTSGLPQWFVIDLGQITTFDAVGYTARQHESGNANGTCRAYKVFVSEEAFDDDLMTWCTSDETRDKVRQKENPAIEGTISYINGVVPQCKIIAPSNGTSMTGRYIMFVFTEAASNFASCAEFDVFQKVDVESGKAYTLKSVGSELYLNLDVNTNSNAKLSATPTPVFFNTEGENQFAISSDRDLNTDFLGVSGWNAVKSGTKTSWSFEAADLNSGIVAYRLRQDDANTSYHGYLGYDDSTEGSALYNNKAASFDWIIEETIVLTEEEKLAAAVEAQLTTISDAFTKLNRAYPVEAAGVAEVIWPDEYKNQFSYTNGFTDNFELLNYAKQAVEDRDKDKLTTAKANLATFINLSNAYGYPREVIYTVSDAENVNYGTVYMPFNTTCPTGLKLYECTGVEGNGYTMTLAAAGNFQSNKAYIIETTNSNVKGNKYQFIAYGNQQGNQANSGTLLVGTHEEMTAPVGSYVLQNQNNVLGFYKVESGNTITVPAHKCYLQLPAEAQGVKFLLFPDGTLTSIDAIDTATPDAGAAYDLSGRRVSTTTKGLYIVGGKKVLVK
ncbi:MAG: discoidin domain-containing protein [Prevotellaceae bacterium]|nr:discoidin domain-containing protein [Prevotellaceae bacterium]